MAHRITRPRVVALTVMLPMAGLCLMGGCRPDHAASSHETLRSGRPASAVPGPSSTMPSSMSPTSTDSTPADRVAARIAAAARALAAENVTVGTIEQVLPMRDAARHRAQLEGTLAEYPDIQVVVALDRGDPTGGAPATVVLRMPSDGRHMLSLQALTAHIGRWTLLPPGTNVTEPYVVRFEKVERGARVAPAIGAARRAEVQVYAVLDAEPVTDAVRVTEVTLRRDVWE